MRADHVHSFPGLPRANRSRGFTLIEMAMTAAVAALLISIALPSYARVIQRQKVAQCVSDLGKIALAIDGYRLQHGAAPQALSQLTMTIPRDPWDQEYRFLNFSTKAPGVKGKIRKDHNLHPLNSEFDLYSIGADGKSSPPLTATAAATT